MAQAPPPQPTPPPPELPACVRELGEEVWATAANDSGSNNSPVSSVWKDQEAAADLLRAVTAAAEANPASLEHWVLLCATTAMFEREFLDGDNILSRAQVRSPLLANNDANGMRTTFFILSRLLFLVPHVCFLVSPSRGQTCVDPRQLLCPLCNLYTSTASCALK